MAAALAAMIAHSALVAWYLPMVKGRSSGRRGWVRVGTMIRNRSSHMPMRINTLAKTVPTMVRVRRKLNTSTGTTRHNTT